MDDKSGSPNDGETLGQFRAREGLPGAGTAAAERLVWCGGRWVDPRVEAATRRTPIGIRDSQLAEVLANVHPMRLDAFRRELSFYVTVWGNNTPGSEHELVIDWATVRRTDERAVVLKVLDFVTKELAMQLAAKNDEGGSRFTRPLPDTVLHEKSIRHDTRLCQHCEYSEVRSVK